MAHEPAKTIPNQRRFSREPTKANMGESRSNSRGVIPMMGERSPKKSTVME